MRQIKRSHEILTTFTMRTYTTREGCGELTVRRVRGRKN